jgi:hypothetical protein
MPQWSPSVTGGSTEETLTNVNLAWGPQWSPPIDNRRDNVDLLDGGPGQAHAAMEPRRS